MGGPGDFAVGGCQFLGCTEVIQLVVVGLGGFGAEAFQQGQRAEAVGLVEVAAMAVRMVFGDQFVALPEEFRRQAVNGFADASAKGVVAVAGGLSVRLGDADQPMLAVVAVFGDELVTFAASLSACSHAAPIRVTAWLTVARRLSTVPAI